MGAPLPAAAQAPLAGYVQGVPLGGTAGGLLSQFNRVRISSAPAVGPFRFGAAYEHVLTLRLRDALPGFALGAVPGGGEWLDLQWTLAEREHVV